MQYAGLREHLCSATSIGVDEKAEMDRIVGARAVKDGVVFFVAWENPDVMAYVKLKARYLDAKRLGALPSHGWASKYNYGRRSCAALYGPWRLRSEK